MVEASIPVDLLNPGQVFACLGFVEAAETLLGDAEGAFDWTDPTDVRFHLRSAGDRSPVEEVLAFLDAASVCGEAPPDSATTGSWKKGWGGLRKLAQEAPYPFPDPPSPATFVCALEAGNRRLTLDHWGDDTRRDNVKFWAGAGGYPGVGLAQDSLALVRGVCLDSAADPFSVARAQSSSFRLDWRRDYIPIDAGFSLNAHNGNIATLGFPIVELLAALGLTNARPARDAKLAYRYAVLGRAGAGQGWYPPALLRAALGCAPLPFATRRFSMTLGYPGKEGQARSITTVTEETIA